MTSTTQTKSTDMLTPQSTIPQNRWAIVQMTSRRGGVVGPPENRCTSPLVQFTSPVQLIVRPVHQLARPVHQSVRTPIPSPPVSQDADPQSTSPTHRHGSGVPARQGHAAPAHCRPARWPTGPGDRSRARGGARRAAGRQGRRAASGARGWGAVSAASVSISAPALTAVW